MALLRSRKCLSCEHPFDYIEQRGKKLVLDRNDELFACPKCDSEESEPALGVPVGIELGGGASTGKIYPYDDAGLGCRVESAAHRRQICRERGLIPVDGDFDPADIMRDQWNAQDRAERANAQYEKELEEAPWFRGYREARDKGLVNAAMRRR